MTEVTPTIAVLAQRLSTSAAAAAARDDLPLALLLYRQAMAQMPSHRGLYPALARVLRRLGRADEADSLILRHLNEAPDSLPGWIGLAEGQRDRGRWQASLATFRHALSLDPGHVGLQRAIAHAAERLLPAADPALALPVAGQLQALLPGLPQRLLLVLGMHRSGTSALAGLLAGDGVQLPAGSPPADPFNPRGYWEPLQLLACHNTLLEEAGGRWDDPRHAPLSPSPGRLQQLALAIAADFPGDGSAAVALVKDPRQCRLQPLWNTLIAQRGLDAAVVLLHRHPLAVARSLQRRDGLPADRALLLWLQHLLEAERHSRHLPRLRCSYTQLLAAPAAVVQACRSLVPGLAPLEPEALAALQQRVDPSLNHGDDPVAEAAATAPDLLALALEVQAALADPDESRCRAVCDQAGLQLEARLRAASDQLGERETAQLFWCAAGETFREASSRRVGYSLHRGVVEGQVPLPAGVGPLAALRLDPGEQPGLIRFLGLVCHSSNGEELWRWTADDGTPLPCTPATPGSRLLQPAEGPAVLLAQDADPAVLLQLPSTVLTALAGGGSIGFAVRWEPIGPDLGQLLAAL